jgi:hypothetical protein
LLVLSQFIVVLMIVIATKKYCRSRVDQRPNLVSRPYSTFNSTTSDTPACAQREAAHSLPALDRQNVIKASRSLRAA